MIQTFSNTSMPRGTTALSRRFLRAKGILNCLAVFGMLVSLFPFVGVSTVQAQGALTFTAVSDARVLQSSPTTNYGTLSRLDVDNPGQESYLRFTVSGVTGAVQNATLRVFVTNGSANGPSIYGTSNTWTETGINWNNRPGATSGVIANVAAMTANTWAEYNVTASVTGDGTYNFVLLPDSTDGITLYSREGTSPPQLVLTVASGPTSTPTNTPTVGPSPTPTNTPPATSTPTNTSTPTATPVSNVMTLGAVADARVLQSNPTTNYATYNRLDVDNPGQESYIRFTVSGVTGAIQNARIRLWVSNSSANGPAMHGTNDTWTETGINWNNRPGATTGVIANVAAMTTNTWSEYNVTAYVTGNGTYSFVLLPESTDGISVHAREGTSPPQLVLTIASGPTPTPTNTSIPTATSIPTSTGTNIPTATATPPQTSTNTPTVGPSPTPTNTATPTSIPTATNTPLNTSTPTNTPVSGSITLPAVADARVLQASPTTNYGALGQLDVDSPGEESYIRFTVSGVTGAIQNATLRLFVTNSSSNGPSIYGITDTWTETGLTWNNRPAATTGALANVNSAPTSTWVEYNLTAYITGDGTYNFVLLPDSSDGIRFDSREGASPPQLVLTFASGPTATPTNTGTPTNTPTAGPSPTPTNTSTPTSTPSGESVVFVGAGDIADCSGDDEATAQLLDNIPGTVYTLGDNAYPSGTAAQYTNCYDPTWGRHKSRTHPTVGDNDYNTSGAVPYYNYFGAAAGNPNEGWYSYNLGSWHIIVLNSNCSEIGGCSPSSAQGQWLQADLAANSSACILAMHHDPYFSSKGGDADMQDFWDPLYQAGADIVLSGHRHMYERFAQQNPNGVADPGRGIRQFVVGTGGSGLTSSPSSSAPNSQVRNNNTHGVLKLTLHANSYDWQFIPVAGQTFTDSGTTQCVTP
jgi:hypothetical protein